MRIGIKGLPSEVDQLTSGGIYALDLETSATRFGLMAAVLEENQESEQPAALVSHLPAEEIISRFRKGGADSLVEAIQSERIILLRTQDDFDKHLFRLGVEHFAQALQEQGVEPGALVIMDHADGLFTMHDPSLSARQAQSYERWCQEQNITAILLFLQHPHASSPASYQRMSDYFSGSGRIHSNGHGRVLSLDYWYGQRGVTDNAMFPLTTSSSGRLSVAASAARPVAKQHGRGGSLVLHNCDAFLDVSPSTVGLSWEHHGSFTSLADRARQLDEGTVLLSYDPSLSFKTIGEQVFLLRCMVKPEVRIAVHEGERSLRYSDTASLLKLGANALLPPRMSRARVALALKSLQGQVWQQAESDDLQSVLEAGHPGDPSGFVPLKVFRQRVPRLLQGAAALEIPCQLVVVGELAAYDLDAAQRSISLTRAGDIAAATADSLLLFFFGCEDEARLDVTQRVLEEAALSAETVYVSCYSDAAAIQRLVEADFQSDEVAHPQHHSSDTVELRDAARGERQDGSVIQWLAESQPARSPAFEPRSEDNHHEYTHGHRK